MQDLGGLFAKGTAVDGLYRVPFDFSWKLLGNFGIVRIQMQLDNEFTAAVLFDTHAAHARQPQQFCRVPALYFSNFALTGHRVFDASLALFHASVTLRAFKTSPISLAILWRAEPANFTPPPFLSRPCHVS